MYDPYNTGMADLHVGHRRYDFDDVRMPDEPCPVNPVYAWPVDDDVVGMLAELAVEAEERWLLERFFEQPTTDTITPGERMRKYLSALEVQNVPAFAGLASRMFVNYGVWLWERNPHLTKADCWRAAVEMGYQGKKNSFYQALHRRGVGTPERFAAAMRLNRAEQTRRRKVAA